MTLYAGDPDNFPEDVEIIDDGEYKDAASAVVPDAANLDRTAYLRKRQAVVAFDQFSDDDTFDVHDTITADTYTSVTGVSVTVPDCEVDDLLVVQAAVSALATGVSGLIRLHASQDAAGTPTATPLNMAKAAVPIGSLPSSHPLLGALAITDAGDCTITLQAKVTTAGGGNSIAILGPHALVVTRYGRGAP